jgi:hypothetical protein
MSAKSTECETRVRKRARVAAIVVAPLPPAQANMAMTLTSEGRGSLHRNEGSPLETDVDSRLMAVCTPAVAPGSALAKPMSGREKVLKCGTRFGFSKSRYSLLSRFAWEQSATISSCFRALTMEPPESRVDVQSTWIGCH